MSQLPPPSPEQQQIIHEIASGKCCTVKACAGSGKTTTMLQIANHVTSLKDNCNRRVVILTYNRSLSDECKQRIKRCNLLQKVWCYTIHGLITKVSGKICNDDSKLIQIVKQWDQLFGEVGPETQIRNNIQRQRTNEGMRRINEQNLLDFDLLMLDEAQDLRPSFYKALCHIIRMNKNYDKSARPPLQMCMVGDTKQMLYDFATYGDDRACAKYMVHPRKYFGEFTESREWVECQLSVSYRLTPNIAQFVNASWGTNIQGGNTTSENLPVEYICRYPFPSNKSRDDIDYTYLQTHILSDAIDEYGAENVMFLAQSVKNEKCPIRVHVNSLMKERDTKGRRKYNFHIKESIRGFEGGADIQNKVRVWTFCGSKGCEADCVVVFGFDTMDINRIVSLNQMCVALSRARKRLIVIHGKSYVKSTKLNGLKKGHHTNQYYPMLGDSSDSLKYSIDCRGKIQSVDVPPYDENAPEGERKSIINSRSNRMQEVLNYLMGVKVVSVDNEPNQRLPFYKSSNSTEEAQKQPMVYVATEFSYFSATEEDRFLNSYATWTKESGVKNRIHYNIAVQFDRTKEDVSALYGEAVVYMIQYERDGFCPNVETVINDAILTFKETCSYDQSQVAKAMIKIQCEVLTPRCQELFNQEFAKSRKISGKELIKFLNTRIKIRKKRTDGNRTIYFPVKAVPDAIMDEHMEVFLAQIKEVYKANNKTPAQWIYLANAVMAFGQYHDKWNQIGTDPNAYSSWVEANALSKGHSRLIELMKTVPLTNTHSSPNIDDINGEFERLFSYDFPEEEIIQNSKQSTVIVGVAGICDWVGQGLKSRNGSNVDLLEIKFCNELGNMHRLQILTYCAMLALEADKSCTGMLYNARTEEMEICRMELKRAKDFLLDISRFKFDGTKRSDCVTKVNASTAAAISISSNNPFQNQSFTIGSSSSKKEHVKAFPVGFKRHCSSSFFGENKVLVPQKNVTSDCNTSLKRAKQEHGEESNRVLNCSTISFLDGSVTDTRIIDLTGDTSEEE
eukprot:CAMPEP_0194263180 /NCGR_PEP_ID=MMETSP0158-20130606/46923_1 /TAXON_ID=33649 /ORGANISM="Thalassionema nitzschioides, Strain L26-B" /LENGTH=1016 /DNA_ID=CAMNT_0039003359 /DNA_START=275 /DNA_END=3325 /DNA_ORIENTATION=+